MGTSNCDERQTLSSITDLNKNKNKLYQDSSPASPPDAPRTLEENLVGPCGLLAAPRTLEEKSKYDKRNELFQDESYEEDLVSLNKDARPAPPGALVDELHAWEQRTGLSFLKACYPLDPSIPGLKWRYLASRIRPLLMTALSKDLKMQGVGSDNDGDDDDGDEEGGADDGDEEGGADELRRFGRFEDGGDEEGGAELRRFQRFEDDDDESITDVFSLLSSCHGSHLVKNDGERVELLEDTFKGKYVLVCCFNVPVPWAVGSVDPQSILNLCHELHSFRDAEVVMVARMNSLAVSYPVFNHFFRGLPSSCLAVPYEDPDRRDHICKELKHGADHTYRLFNTDGTILPPFLIDFISYPYGAEALPLTAVKAYEMNVQRDTLLHSQNATLEQLLRPYEFSPMRVAVYKFGSREEGCISEVIKGDTHVGLYMCTEGSLIPFLHNIYERCRVKKLKFEIVVLYCPFLARLDPKIFQDEMDGLFQKQNLRDLWCLPFNNSVSLRFLGLTQRYDPGYMRTDGYGNDKLIIVGTDGKILDVYGAEVIMYGSGFDSYPFTREAHVKVQMQKLRENVTLELLLPAKVFRGTDWSDSVSAGELISSKKKIILHMDLSSDILYGLEELVSEYKERCTEVELVYIGDVEDCRICEIPWYVYPVDGERTPALDYLWNVTAMEALVGFGEDGHVCSFKSLDNATISYCMNDTLYENLYRMHYSEFLEV